MNQNVLKRKMPEYKLNISKVNSFKLDQPITLNYSLSIKDSNKNYFKLIPDTTDISNLFIK
jgi:hypothetical protein